jgi:8-oxo-dGTP pyrophosphatase MutT (NUDIX family)
VLPGGHVDPGDQSLEAALSREISEEIAGEADIISMLQVLDSGAGDERRYFCLGRITSWDFAARAGREFAEPGFGTCRLEQIPLFAAGLGAIDLKPAAIARLLCDAFASGRDLFMLSDLQSAP